MLAGVPSVFIRLAGCPLRCRWCDTAYAWDYAAGTEYAPADLVAAVGRFSCAHVVVTGGEPMVGPDLTARPGLLDLTRALKNLGQHITIETAGVRFVPDLACDLMSISPKLSNASDHERTCCDLTAAKSLIEAYPYQIKLVIDSPEDMPEVHEVLRQLGDVDPQRVMLMPQARTRQEFEKGASVVAQLCLEAGLRFGPRLQAVLWENRPGT